MINSRNIEDLHSSIQPKAKAFLAATKAAGYNVRITSTLRDNAYQNSLYAQGRTKPGKIVTYAKAGQSWHNFGLAFDFAVLEPDGDINWNDLKSFKACRAIGIKLGLEGLSFELAHLQYRGGLTLAQAAAGRRPKEVK